MHNLAILLKQPLLAKHARFAQLPCLLLHPVQYTPKSAVKTVTMQRVFSRQSPSAEYTDTDCTGFVPAVSAHKNTSSTMGKSTCAVVAEGCVSVRLSQNGASQPLNIRANDVGKQHTPHNDVMTMPFRTADTTKNYRRSCHGTVANDQLCGGTTATGGSWQNLPVAGMDDSRVLAAGNRHVKKADLAAAHVACKDASSKQQADQKQQYSWVQQSLLTTTTFSIDSAGSWPITERYATPFAAPDVQACTCHVEVRRKPCKQHPRRRMLLVADRMKQLFSCTACFKA